MLVLDLMEDYKQAQTVFEQIIADMREDRVDGILRMSPGSLIGFLVQSVHVLYKTKQK